MRLSFRQLEVLQVVVETGSATEAARTLHITQSAVSQILKEVENYFEVKLFYRKAGQLQLTPEAQELMPFIDRVMRDVTLLNRHTDFLRGADAGLITVAAMSTITARLLPETIARFKSFRPRVRFQLEWLPNSTLIRHIKDEIVDMGIATGPVDDPGVRSEPVWRLPIVCASPKGHRFGRLDAVTLKDLEGESVISSTAATPAGRLLRSHFDREALARITAIETNYSTATVELVRHGAGVGLIHPLEFIGEETDSINLTPLDPPVELEFVFIFSAARPRTILLDGFVDEVRRTIAAFADRLEKSGFRSEMIGPPLTTA
jgi:DNA-binding transcriptional LysR family regulator